MTERYLFTAMLSAVIAFAIMGNPHALATEKSPNEKLVVLDLKVKNTTFATLGRWLSMSIKKKIGEFRQFEIQHLSQQDNKAIDCNEDDNKCFIAYGKTIGARYIVVGVATKQGTSYEVSLRLIDTDGKSAGEIKRETQIYPELLEFKHEMVQELATKLVKDIQVQDLNVHIRESDIDDGIPKFVILPKNKKREPGLEEIRNREKQDRQIKEIIDGIKWGGIRVDYGPVEEKNSKRSISD